MNHPRVLAIAAAVLSAAAAHAEQASPPQGVTLTIYDAGFALVSENRRVNLAQGDNEIVARQLPARIDASTCSLAPLAGSVRLDLMDVRFENDVANDRALFDRYVGRPVSVSAGGRDLGGRLLAGPRRTNESGQASALVLETDDGGARAFLDPGQISSVSFPKADTGAFLEPTLVWSARSDHEGLQNIRLTYLTAGLGWRAAHEVVLLSDGAAARFSSRVGLRNSSGGRFNDARVRLVATEQPAPAESASPRRFTYGQNDSISDARGSVIQAKGIFELPLPATLADGQERFFELARVDTLPVSRFFVYDGVRLDRFQRNPRGDWNYGTEFNRAVELHAEIQLPKAMARVPGGSLRLFQEMADGGLDYLGRNEWVEPDENGRFRARIGAARGLTGERERTAFNEVRPQHEYAETFEIRLSNMTEESVEIRVVEHLYRGAEYEIAKTDTEYVSTAPQVIEFRPVLKPGGKQSIRYTVRYRW